MATSTILILLLVVAYEVYGGPIYPFPFRTDGNKLLVDVPPPNESIKDYKPLLSAAINAIEVHGGGKLLLSKGTYLLGSRLVIQRNGTGIYGKSEKETTLRLMNGKAGDVIAAFAGMGTVTHNLTLDANGARYGLSLWSADDAEVYYTTVMNARDAGFLVRGQGLRILKNAKLANCHAKNNGEGIRIARAKNVTLISVLSYHSAGNGIRIEGGANVLMRHCNIWGSGLGPRRGCGLSVGGASSADVFGGVIEDASNAGVCVRGAKVNLEAVRIENRRGTGCVDAEENSVQVLSGYCETRVGIWTGAGPQPLGTCKIGVQNEDVCCAVGCATCEGIGCKQQKNGVGCCYDVIKAVNRSCALHPAPCVLTERAVDEY